MCPERSLRCPIIACTGPSAPARGRRRGRGCQEFLENRRQEMSARNVSKNILSHTAANRSRLFQPREIPASSLLAIVGPLLNLVKSADHPSGMGACMRHKRCGESGPANFTKNLELFKHATHLPAATPCALSKKSPRPGCTLWRARGTLEGQRHMMCCRSRTATPSSHCALRVPTALDLNLRTFSEPNPRRPPQSAT